MVSLYSYFRKSSLTVIFSKVPDLDFKSQYVNQHRHVLVPAQKNNFGIDARINYFKRVLVALYFVSDHACLDLHLKPNFKIDLARKANTRFVSTRIRHETPSTCVDYHVHVHLMHDIHALQVGLSVWICIQQKSSCPVKLLPFSWGMIDDLKCRSRSGMNSL